jgi:hypothetical protein
MLLASSRAPGGGGLVYATDAFATLVPSLFRAPPNSRPDDHGEEIQDDPDVPAAAPLRSVNESS